MSQTDSTTKQTERQDLYELRADLTADEKAEYAVEQKEALLYDHLLDVHRARVRAERTIGEAQLLRAHLTEQVEHLTNLFYELHKDIFTKEESAKRQLADAELEARTAVISAYEETGNKSPISGAQVRVTTSYNYPVYEALDWAKSHNMALTLDKKSFAEICKSDAIRPEFVIVEKTASAALDSDLEGVLVKAGLIAKGEE